MDKMTDAKIRAWLERHKPDLLTAYHLYQADRLADLSTEPEDDISRPESLRSWLANRHPQILEQIALR
jgi:hypothetical protein